MPTTTVSTISLTGVPDYSTLQAWEDDAPANLVTDDVVWQGQISLPGDVFSGSGVLLTMSGSTSDTTRYKELTTASGASFRDNAGAATNALRYNESNGCAITSTVGFNDVVSLNEVGARISNIQIRSSGNAKPLRLNATDCIADNMICQNEVSGSYAAALAQARCEIRNSLLVQRDASATAIAFMFGATHLYNVTLVVPSDVAVGTNGIDESFYSGTVNSCIIMGVTNNSDSTGGTYTTCLTSDATPPTGCTTATYADIFENTADATQDYRLKTGSPAIDAGTFDATNAPNDIIGTARGSGTADVGAWEFVGGGSGAALAGNADAVATATGNLSIGAALGGDALAIATATGRLQESILLAGDAIVISTASGTLFEIMEGIITMARRAQGRKKSVFPALNTIPAGATFDFVSGGVNYKIPILDLLSSLNVTGTIVQAGNPAAVPVLDIQGTVHNIRNIEAGSGISASVSVKGGVALTHNFKTGTGGVPILTGTTDVQPQIGNIIAGANISVATVPGGVQIATTASPVATSTVIINSMSDFPDPVLGVRTLAIDTDYFIASDLVTTDRFDVSAGNIVIRAADQITVSFLYTGTGDMFTGVDASFSLLNITIGASLGRCFNITGSGGTEIFRMNNVTIASCDRVGIFGGANFHAVEISHVTADSIITGGIEFTGVIEQFTGSFNDWTVASGTMLELGATVFQYFSSINNVAEVASGATFMSGMSGSANIASGSLGRSVDNAAFGAGTALSGITPDDSRWEFQLNDSVRDTRNTALISLTNNATATTIVSVNTPVKAAGVWVAQLGSQFTVDTAGRATYTGPKDSSLPVTISSSARMAAGGNKNISLYVAVNGVVVATSAARAEVGVDGGRITIVWSHVFSTSDFVELWVENNSDTTNIVITDSVLRVE